jgi:glycosyltransferase involved in cell wall biosynthesis
MKHIVFLVSGSGWKPIGGLKVIYEYANRFASDNFSVSIVYAASMFFKKNSIKEKIRSLVRFAYFEISRDFSCKKWFKLDKRIKEIWQWNLEEKRVPNADIYFATAVKTSIYLNEYQKINPNNKYYLIQHFENWSDEDSKIIDTYHYQMKKIVISKWLQDLLKQNNEESILIRNGFNPTCFFDRNPIFSRDKFHVSMLYNVAKWKGCADAFKALEIAKKKYPQLKVSLFGIYDPPKNLQAWYDYYKNPDKDLHNQIYNESAIFVGASHSEGFGLTIGEAMLCGCAVACTDNKGYLEMAKNEETALVSPVQDVEKLADNIIRLIENDELRYRIAKNGNTYLKEFTWEKSYSLLKSLF